MSDPPEKEKPAKIMVPPGLSETMKQIQESAAQFQSTIAQAGRMTPTLTELDSLAKIMRSSLPKMDNVIAASTATGADLRGLASMPLKSGAEYAVEGVRSEVTRLAEIMAAMADNTGANAEIAKTGLEQSIALVAGLRDLHETTRRGMDANERSARALVWLTRVLAVLTIELVIVTLVLVMQGTN